MILADKIIQLRKKNRWSQEELAQKMNVSRQAVSKWESAQSVPDLEKVLLLGRIFGVSTDYLLKDEIEETEYAQTAEEPEASVRRVSMEEANAYLKQRETASGRIALAAFLCILSPIGLLLLGAMSEAGSFGISQRFAGGLGLTILLLLVAAAVAIFITCGSKNAPFEYMEKEPFETEYGVSGMVKERQLQFRETYTRFNVLGVCICILSVIPVCAGSILTENELSVVLMVCLTLLMCGIGVLFLISAGVKWESMEKLLQEGDYTRKRKADRSLTAAVGTAYWLIAAAIYLAWSFYSNNWNESWIVWPIAGILYGALMAILSACRDKLPKKLE